MQVTDEECEEFRRLYLAHEGVELTLDETREMLSKLLVLVEWFAVWVAKEKAAGRVFQVDEHPPEREGTYPPPDALSTVLHASGPIADSV